MNKNYKLNKRILKNVIKNKIKCVNSKEKLKWNIYYKNLKTKNLVMRNNINESKSILKTYYVVYKVSCPSEYCVLSYSYYVDKHKVR